MYNLLDKELFLKNRPRLAKQRSVRPLSRLKTVDLDCRSSLSVAQMVRFWFKSLQSLTTHDRQFLQGNLFLLAVCTHDVGLYLCSIFCTRSLLQFSAASYRAFGAWNTPQLYPVTLTLCLKNKVYSVHTSGSFSLLCGYKELLYFLFLLWGEPTCQQGVPLLVGSS